MVPDSYHDFFIGGVTVAGALVGLLFVAISVHPSGMADSAPMQRVQATCALSALLNALFVCLYALLPSRSLGVLSLVFGISGALTMVTLLLVVFTRIGGLGRWAQVRGAFMVVGQGAVFVLQIVNSISLMHNERNLDDVGTETTLVLIFFGFGVARAWEYVGGRRTGFWGTVDQVRDTMHHAAAAPSAGEEPSEASEKPTADKPDSTEESERSPA